MILKTISHPVHGECRVLEVEDGKYGFVLNADDVLVELQRYGEKWNDDPVYLISYNRAIWALALESTRLLEEDKR